MVNYNYDNYVDEYLDADPRDAYPTANISGARKDGYSSKQEALLRKIMEYDFYAIDLNLYLDTHPTDRRAIRMFREAVEKSNSLKKEYNKLYGPLTAADVMDNDYWTWIYGPWPWER